jgi:hypothetical protein
VQEVVSHAAFYEHRLVEGQKAIFHLEVGREERKDACCGRTGFNPALTMSAAALISSHISCWMTGRCPNVLPLAGLHRQVHVRLQAVCGVHVLRPLLLVAGRLLQKREHAPCMYVPM